jgi:hypothetical protein
MTFTIRSPNGEAVHVDVVGSYVQVNITLLDLQAARELIEALVEAVNEASIHSVASGGIPEGQGRL